MAGIAELVGDYVLTCQGGNAGLGTTTFRLTLNAEITSRVLTSNLTEALLLVDEPNARRQDGSTTPLIPNVSAFQGRLIGPNTLEFANVPYKIRGGSSATIFRFANVRANISKAATANSTWIVGKVTASNLLIGDPNQGLASVSEPTMSIAGQASEPAVLSGCVPHNPGLLSGGGSGTVSFHALLSTWGLYPKLSSDGPQNMAGVVYNTESGFFDPSLPMANNLQPGVATQATRIVLTMRNIPPGVSVFVTKDLFSASNKVTGALIDAGPYSGGSSLQLPTTMMATDEGRTVGIRPISVVSGTAQAVWEITERGDTIQRYAGIALAYNSAPPTSVDIELGLAPLVPENGTSAFLPRFARSGLKSTLPIAACGNRDISLRAPYLPSLEEHNGNQASNILVENLGTQAETFTLEAAIYRDENLSALVATLPPRSIYSLNPKEIRTSSLNLPPLAAGEYYLAVKADSLNQVPEGNERNNLISYRLQVDRCVESIYVDGPFIQRPTCNGALTSLTPGVTLSARDSGYLASLPSPEIVGLIKSNNTGAIVAVSDASRAFTISVEPSVLSGATVSATAEFHRQGKTPLDLFYLLVNDSVSSAHACFAEYNLSANTYRLLDDSGMRWLGPVSGGSKMELENSQCRLVAGTPHPIFPDQPDLRVWYFLDFKQSFAGPKNVYLLERDLSDSINTGWQQHATWNIPGNGLPLVRSVSPIVGAGGSSIFSAEFRHSRGNTGHYLSYVLFLPTPNIVNYTATGSCLVEYNRINNSVRLINDAGNDWLGPVAITPIALPLSNLRCTVDVSKFFASVDVFVRVGIPVTFKPAMGPVVATFQQSLDMKGQWTGMTQFGNWTVPNATATRLGPYIAASGVVNGASHSVVNTIVAHTAGIQAVSVVHLRLASNIVGSGAWCHAIYFPATNTFNLLNDAGTGLIHPTGVAPGSDVTLSNNVCELPMSQAAVAKGQTLSITFPIARTSLLLKAYTHAWVNAFDNAGLLTHWIATPDVALP